MADSNEEAMEIAVPSTTTQDQPMNKHDYAELRTLMTRYLISRSSMDEVDLEDLVVLMMMFADVGDAGEYASLGISETEARECENECCRVAQRWERASDGKVRAMGRGWMGRVVVLGIVIGMVGVVAVPLMGWL